MRKQSFTHMALIWMAMIFFNDAMAATISVNSTANVSADDGQCTLREAIFASNLNQASGAMAGECAAGDAASDVIDFVGLTTPAVIDVGQVSLPTINESVTVVGPGVDQLTIVGNNTDPIFRVDARLAISHMQINAGGSYGSGVRMDSGNSLTLTNCLFADHTPSSGGGVVLFRGSADTATLTVDDCLFENNSQTNGSGSAINLSTINGNAQIDASINHSQFINNHTTGSGGAISIATGFNSETFLKIHDSVFQNNLAERDGGAIYTNQPGALVLIKNSSFINNQAAEEGGALFLTNVTTVLVNSTLDGNLAGIFGGGASLFAPSEEIGLIISSTITNNTANTANNNGLGGGLVALGNIQVRNSVLAENSADFGAESPDCFGDIISQGHNLIGDVLDCDWLSDPSDLLGDSSGMGVLDPQLMAVADNGGVTPTRLPMDSSPLLDVIDPADCLDEEDLPLISDQRGISRPQDSQGGANAQCDIGAVERVFDDLIFASNFE